MALAELRGASKSFGGLSALKDVSMSIDEGEIRGLIGPNGAGKTTLFNLMAGNYRADAGSFLFDGRETFGLTINERVALGIVRTFQNIRLFGTMTALDNVRMGFHCRTSAGWLSAVFNTGRSRGEEAWTTSESERLLEELDLLPYRNELAKNLSYGNQRRLEIARAMASRPRLLLLDEPAAGMNESEGRQLLERIRAIRGSGVTILVVEHDMTLLMAVSDRVTVLAHGLKIAEGSPDQVQVDERVIVEYLGKGAANVAG
ncbi:MAG: ABC transporter ATP-binding protein [Planctomycetota bacterium]|jgi:branched-chain amino acid transport system ATP-binding protein|nr:ABC transporter ATP-binding protein [Planctomycetota bacterium]